ncbi:alpha/beta hydrolase [Sandaracinus amylolyticus]|uniref:Alpha/beta hydrolase n=1 Tax=Sandaracinus amylolyticus TaxID=927083 RepID=A0A0F6W8B0_9BACT|nr:alpha/beta fold hydrolase [Sandaracinus amylolyticus]AKF09865.1 Alpha/beta hydrolase [Sandaracinus amylolyticus]
MSIEPTSFESRGERCAATWYWPDGGGERWPCVVLANGFSGTRDWILPDFGARFAGAGIAALTFDYRHLGESGGAPRQIVDVGEQRADLRAALAHARRDARIDPRRVALWGTSLGGSHALDAAAGDPEVAALILNMPALDAVSGGNVEEKRKRVGVSRARTAAITLRLIGLALRDLARRARGADPLYLAVYGAPGEAFFTDPELAPRFRRVAEGSPTWQNRVAARFLLGAPRYRSGTFERVKAPILICLAEHDIEVSTDFIRAKAKGAASADVRTYPVGHFDLYHGDAFEKVVSDQVAFLRAHLKSA